MLPIVLKLWDSILLGNAPDKVQKTYERMKHPVSGDLVTEISTAFRLLSQDPDLLNDRWDGQFVVYSHSFNSSDHVCVNLDGTIFNWNNAQLLAVPPFKEN